MDDAPEAGFGSALDRLTLGAGLAAIQERAKSALTEASTAVHNMDDLRRQGLQAAREKAANVEFFNLDGLQEKDPYMVTAGAAAEGGGGGDGGGAMEVHHLHAAMHGMHERFAALEQVGWRLAALL